MTASPALALLLLAVVVVLALALRQVSRGRRDGMELASVGWAACLVLVLAVGATAVGVLGAPHGEQEVVGGGGARVSSSAIHPLWIVGAVLTLVLLGLMFLTVLTGGITPRRLTSFTLRQHLRLTTANAAQVGRALTVQYRWRRLGVWAGGVSGVLLTALVGAPQLSVAVILGGWFAGAAFAEFRVSRPVDDGPRRAGLAARSAARFATLGVRVTTIAVGSLLAMMVLVAGVLQVAQSRADLLEPSLVLVLVWAVLAILFRRVVGRPAPAQPADLVAADDALRCQALAVLSGSAVALSGFSAAEIATWLLTESGMPPDDAGSVGGLLVLALAGLGWWLASWSPSPRRDRADAPQPSVSPAEGLA